MTSLAIRAEGLRKSYGTVRALDGLDLSAEEGTVLGVLGPNGAGKTTAVRILATLLRPDGGHAEVGGFDVVTQAAEVRRRIGLGGQYAALDEELTGFENLRMFGQLYHLSRASASRRADELLGGFDLAEAAGRLVKTYSGGMRHRLDLAASLIVAPPIMFLDEPTTGLDPRGRLAVWDVIGSLVTEGTTVLLTTQYLEEADRLAHRIAVIDHGRVIAAGSADELKARIGGERLDLTLAPGTDLPAARRALAAHASGEIALDGEHRHLTVPIAPGTQRLAAVVRDLEAGGIDVGEFALRRPTLDDVFFALTGRGMSEGEPESTAEQEHRPMTGASFTRRDIAPAPRAAPYWVLADTLVMARRQLTRMWRVPDELVTTALQPIVFVVLFRYILGGAIAVPGASYVNYLMPGLMVISLIMGSAFTGIGIATDLQRGLVDRFRSLPMAGSAVLSGRILADLLRSAFIVLLVWVVGLLVGFRPGGTLADWLAATGLLLLGSLVLAWLSALMGLLLSGVEAIQQAFVIWALPLMFASSALVPPGTMADWLRPFVEHQPVTLLINAVRALLLGQPDMSANWQTTAWCLGLLAIIIPLTIWAYGRRTAR